MQSKRWSLIETLVNVGAGFLISLVAQVVIFQFYGIQLSAGDNIEITAWFTVISIIRGYAIRRVFNNFKREEQK